MTTDKRNIINIPFVPEVALESGTLSLSSSYLMADRRGGASPEPEMGVEADILTEPVVWVDVRLS